MPRTGIAFSGGPTPAEIVDCVNLAEQLGYESARVAEGHGGDQFAVLAACATQTSRILGTSINRSALLGLVDGLDGRDHGFAKPVGEELVEIGLDALGAGIFDRLLHRFRRALRVFGEHGDGFFEPPVRGAGGVPDADLGVLVRALAISVSLMPGP